MTEPPNHDTYGCFTFLHSKPYSNASQICAIFDHKVRCCVKYGFLSMWENSVRATAVGRDVERDVKQNAVLAGDPKRKG